MINTFNGFDIDSDVRVYQPGTYSPDDIESARIVGPKVTVIGGGTGLSTLLKGLKDCTENITAIVTVADDGGGSGVLRDELGILPPGDIRNCVIALANAEPAMTRLFNYRFTDGSLRGQSLGNLVLAALNDEYGSFVEAVQRMSDVLAITGRVLPVTVENILLRAMLEDGSEVLGESKIHDFKKTKNCRISEVFLEPASPAPLEDALDAIRGADMIVLGPGSLYTSIIPNLLVPGIPEAIAASRAVKVYACNVMTQEGETEGYTAFDHAAALTSHSRGGVFDICLVNNALVPPDIIEKYRAEDAEPTHVDRDRFAAAHIELVERDLLASGEKQNYARHDPKKLAAELIYIFASHRSRHGIYGRYDRMLAEWATGRSVSRPNDFTE